MAVGKIERSYKSELIGQKQRQISRNNWERFEAAPEAPSGIRLCVSDTKEHPVGNFGPMGTELEISSSLVLGRQDKVVRQAT